MNKNYLIIFISFLSFGIFAEQSLPLNSIVELDEIPYLVNMIKEDNGSIAYRTYPFGAINQAGYYKLANTVTNAISINASNVTLDLSGQLVSGGIVVQSDLENITIKDGIVDVNQSVAQGVELKSGCHNISISNLIIKNATTNNLLLSNVSDSLIKNCDFYSSVTGVAIGNCNNLTFENCTSTGVMQEGFCMMSSSTCTLRNCKAISTGEGNTDTETVQIYGFVSDNGHSNVFDNCIANGTQAKLNEQFASIVAGFCLRNNIGPEQGTQIINCQASNASASTSGFVTPYGIYLEPKVNDPFETIAIDDSNNYIYYEVSWHPNGNYFAVCNTNFGSTNPTVAIYKFDRKNLTITKIINTGYSPNRSYSIDWSPSGNFIAYGTDNTRLVILEFDSINESITELQQIILPGDLCKSVHWRSDENFIVIVNSQSGNTDRAIRIYEFNNITKTASLVATDPYAGNLPTGTEGPFAQWRPDGKFIATNVDDAFEMKILYFNESTNSITTIDSDQGYYSSRGGMRWSPDGKYIASGGGIFLFNESTSSLTEIINTNLAFGFDWTPDGRYLVTGTYATSGGVRIYLWNRIDAPTLIATADAYSDSVGVAFSPDGRFIASVQTFNGAVRVYDALAFPQYNIIKNCITFCNSADELPGGVGIAGSSVENVIIQNTSYSNPINAAVLEINYAYCPNVFNPLFQDYPQLNQNIGPAALVPIEPPANQVCMLNLLNSKLCDIQSKIDLLIAANS